MERKHRSPSDRQCLAPAPPYCLSFPPSATTCAGLVWRVTLQKAAATTFMNNVARGQSAQAGYLCYLGHPGEAHKSELPKVALYQPVNTPTCTHFQVGTLWCDSKCDMLLSCLQCHGILVLWVCKGKGGGIKLAISDVCSLQCWELWHVKYQDGVFCLGTVFPRLLGQDIVI